LAHGRYDSFILPSLLDPRGIEAACIHAGHSTGTGQQTKIGPEIAAPLPERRRVKIQFMLTGERAKIDVHHSAESVPTCKSLLLFALEIPEGIADVLKIEAHSMVLKARTHAGLAGGSGHAGPRSEVVLTFCTWL
jgi:hypothetical protein